MEGLWGQHMSSDLHLSYLGEDSTEEQTTGSRKDIGARKRNLAARSRVVTFKSVRLNGAAKEREK